MKKLAVIFPGMGYHTDKPLLYYSKKLAKQYGYEIAEVPYGGFLREGKSREEELRQAFFMAMEQTEELLKEIQWGDYGKLLFISKSIGTAVAAAYAGQHQLEADHILFTPVEETFQFVKQKGIVFHGTSDPLADTAAVRRACREKGLPLFLIERGNHSLETGRVSKDLEHMVTVMEQVERYLQEGI